MPVAALIVLSSVGCKDSDPFDPGAVMPGPITFKVDGLGEVPERFTAELTVRGDVAYTSTWGGRTFNGVRSVGNAIKIWNVAGSALTLVDSVIVPNATTLGDIQVSDDGKLLVVATEFSPGSIAVFDLTNPLKPALVSRFSSANTIPGVHTAEVERVNGKLYAFLCVDLAGITFPARLVIVDLSNPASPVEVMSRVMGSPFVHDVFVREGILMTALWDAGIAIFEIGGAGRGGTIANPVQIGSVATEGGQAHNIWWLHDPVTGSKKFAFVGEEGPALIGTASSGDIHVVDVSDMTKPREVAFFSLAGAGTHNFSVDESRGVLYAAYYNAGVRALNVRGDLGNCTPAERAPDGRCDLAKMGRDLGGALTDQQVPVYVWGVQFSGSKLYASDMLNGLWKLSTQ
ncbi:MAG TPA: hypothetical protein VIF83_07260 [Gemmatimonadaceae bacterium]